MDLDIKDFFLNPWLEYTKNVYSIPNNSIIIPIILCSLYVKGYHTASIIIRRWALSIINPHNYFAVYNMWKMIENYHTAFKSNKTSDLAHNNMLEHLYQPIQWCIMRFICILI